MQFGVMLGTFASGAIAGDHTVILDDLLLADIGPLPTEEHVAANTTNFFGNSLTDTTTVMLNRGGDTARANDKFYIWSVISLAWDCGSLVDADFKIENNKFIADMRTLGDNNWSVQVKYKTKLLNETGTYTLTFSVVSNTNKIIYLLTMKS
jgi:hypothetical protein